MRSLTAVNDVYTEKLFTWNFLRWGVSNRTMSIYTIGPIFSKDWLNRQYTEKTP